MSFYDEHESVFDVLCEGICKDCVHRQYIRNCYRDCPFNAYFAELKAKCQDIEMDAKYLTKLANDEDSVEYDGSEPEGSLEPWSRFATTGGF